MKNLINKFRKIEQIKISERKLVEALSYIAAVSIALFGCNSRNDKRILKIEKSDYVEFHDSNGKIYEDFGKDKTLDYFYDAKELDAFEIVDAPGEAKNYAFKQIFRNSDKVINLQIELNKIREAYEKQGEEK